MPVPGPSPVHRRRSPRRLRLDSPSGQVSIPSSTHQHWSYQAGSRDRRRPGAVRGSVQRSGSHRKGGGTHGDGLHSRWVQSSPAKDTKSIGKKPPTDYRLVVSTCHCEGAMGWVPIKLTHHAKGAEGGHSLRPLLLTIPFENPSAPPSDHLPLRERLPARSILASGQSGPCPDPAGGFDPKSVRGSVITFE